MISYNNLKGNTLLCGKNNKNIKDMAILICSDNNDNVMGLIYNIPLLEKKILKLLNLNRDFLFNHNNSLENIDINIGGKKTTDDIFILHKNNNIKYSTHIINNIYLSTDLTKVNANSFSDGDYKLFIGCMRWKKEDLLQQILSNKLILVKTDCNLVMSSNNDYNVVTEWCKEKLSFNNYRSYINNNNVRH